MRVGHERDEFNSEEQKDLGEKTISSPEEPEGRQRKRETVGGKDRAKIIVALVGWRASRNLFYSRRHFFEVAHVFINLILQLSYLL